MMGNEPEIVIPLTYRRRCSCVTPGTSSKKSKSTSSVVYKFEIFKSIFIVNLFIKTLTMYPNPEDLVCSSEIVGVVPQLNITRRHSERDKSDAERFIFFLPG